MHYGVNLISMLLNQLVGGIQSRQQYQDQQHSRRDDSYACVEHAWSRRQARPWQNRPQLRAYVKWMRVI
jgi:hypothetical protein